MAVSPVNDWTVCREQDKALKGELTTGFCVVVYEWTVSMEKSDHLTSAWREVQSPAAQGAVQDNSLELCVKLWSWMLSHWPKTNRILTDVSRWERAVHHDDTALKSSVCFSLHMFPLRTELRMLLNYISVLEFELRQTGCRIAVWI